MKKLLTILGVCLAFSVMANPAAATTDVAPDEQPPVACELDLPPSADDCTVYASNEEVCKQQYPPQCEAGPVACDLGHPPAVDDCELALSTTGTAIPPPCIFEQSVDAGEKTVRITVGHCS